MMVVVECSGGKVRKFFHRHHPVHLISMTVVGFVDLTGLSSNHRETPIYNSVTKFASNKPNITAQ